MRGANASVVGIQAAALYDPVWISAVGLTWDFAVAVTGFVLLTVWKAPPFTDSSCLRWAVGWSH
ncbi:hypothetical protein [Solirhodobacter olei]|uniref:hypothetical protein n=1 Tax=Solirhodobacter olei TaxID=2493082 RepID=UPI0019D45110|nr:hypothetical protein [Solirhodobacter olei]